MKKLTSITLCFILAAAGCLAQNEKFNLKVKKAGTLVTLLTAEQQKTCTSLTLSGKINSDDLIVLRRMAGYAEDGESGGTLRWLDLRDCKVEKGKTPYMVLDAQKSGLAVTGLPTKALIKTGVIVEFIPTNFKPTLFLGHMSGVIPPCETMDYKIDETKMHVGGNTFIGNMGGRPAESDVNLDRFKKPLLNVGDFQFAKGLSDEEWEEMKRMEMNKGKGFEIIQENGRYMLYAYTEKDKILHAAFYGCPHLKVLAIPDKAEMDFTIRDVNTSIQFMQESEKK